MILKPWEELQEEHCTGAVMGTPGLSCSLKPQCLGCSLCTCLREMPFLLSSFYDKKKKKQRRIRSEIWLKIIGSCTSPAA